MAATLTVAQIALIRLYMGDACSTLTEPEMQLAYNEANGDDCQTLVILYTWAIARLKPEKLRLVDGREVFSSATLTEYRLRRAEWQACAGSVNGVSIGTAATFTYRADSLQTTEPDYSADTLNEV